jgi:aldehyde:ferredoxin oxidoreductase
MDEEDMRTAHDMAPEWIFTQGDAEAFTEGSRRMDPEDFELAKDYLYEQLGWDKETGMPTQATLEELGMGDVARKLAAAGLLPA